VVSIDPGVLAASLHRLTARRDAPAGVLSALDEVTAACVALFGVSGAGIMVADEQNITRYVSATDDPGRLLETAESETGQGPCTQAFIEGRVCASTDVASDARWPELAERLAGCGVHAVLGVPVRLGAVPVGTLDVYRDRPHDWDDTECAALGRYADVIETTLAAALSAHAAGELADQLQYALDHRVAIERGIGYLMARDGLDAVAAFNRLRAAARASRSKIGAAAAHLLATGDLPGSSD
jgi:transcriptional regulator with GAF, ATPase, and Fis domain